MTSKELYRRNAMF